jgi:hypothetical protein
MAVAYNPTPIDFSALESMGANIGEGMKNRRLRGALGPNGEIDFNALWQADPQTALKYKVSQDSNSGDSALDYLKYDILRRQQELRENPRPSPTDRKAMRDAKLDATRTEQALGTLREAYGLIGEKGDGIYDQYGAGIAADIGTKIPVVSEWLGEKGYIDRGKAMRTQKFRQLMGPEALKYLSAVLKGPTSEKEMAKFMEIYNNADTPNIVKSEMLRTLIRASEADLAVQQGIVNEEGTAPAGAAPADEGQFADEGEEVEGPDGQTYVVRGGQLVPQ